MTEPKTIKLNGDFDPTPIQNKNTADSILDKYIKPESPEPPELPPQDEEFNMLQQQILAPPPKPESFEERLEKMKLRGTINKYLNSRFGEYLTTFKSIDITTLNKDELEEILLDIRLTVDSHESNIFDFESYISAAATIEHVLVSNGFAVHGMTDNLHKSKKIPRLVDQISLARDLQMKPELQLLLLTLYTIKATTDSNKQNAPLDPKLNDNLKKPASKHLKDKYKDLDKISN